MEEREKKERGEQGEWGGRSEQEATPACSPSLPSACRVQAAQVSSCHGREPPLSSEGPPRTQQQSGVQTSALLSGAALRSWSDSGAKVLFSLLSGSLQACASKWRGPRYVVLWGSCSTVILNALNQESLGGASGTHSQSACRGRPWDSARSSRRDPGETWSPQPWGKGKRAQIPSRVRRAGEKLVPASLTTSDFEDCRMRPGQHLKAHSARQVTLRSEEAGGPMADRSCHEKGLTSADCCLVGLSEGPDFLIFQEKLKIQISCEIC